MFIFLLLLKFLDFDRFFLHFLEVFNEHIFQKVVFKLIEVDKAEPTVPTLNLLGLAIDSLDDLSA
jgi:hypothetical protein